MPPHRIIWEVAGDCQDLFAVDMFETPPRTAECSARHIPRRLLEQIQFALLHDDPDRFALAYRLLWRLGETPALASDPADPDMIALGIRAKAVRRDMHKMHAFVRFRKVGETHGRECFAAWFEPNHHIGRAVADFFRSRFTGMNWLIVTPAVSIAWDGIRLTEGPGGLRSDLPANDAVEEEWRTYYSNIFNPARVKIAAMKREMPVRYWRNLPEAVLISGLVQTAEGKVASMVRTKDNASLPAMPQEARSHFPNLTVLYEALQAEDVPPSAGFSDRTVPGEGPENARLILVGEQPGDDEDLTGRPFVGRAGQLLRACLKEAGIDEKRILFTNAVKRFKFMPRGKRRLHQTPTAGDIKHYRWWLAEELRIVNPDIVVALGASALQALLGKRQPLASLRGALISWNGRKLLVTVHPSFLLRLPDEQARKIERERFVRELGTATLRLRNIETTQQ